MISVDPALFQDAAISSDMKELNDFILKTMETLPEPFIFPPEMIRKVRMEGKGIFPLPNEAANAEILEIKGPIFPVSLRVIRPTTRSSRGAFLHIHGGGWMFGSAREHDDYLVQAAEATGLTSVSVDYRLAPEMPYPAAQDDCEAAALWLFENTGALFGGNALVIGGESAGAQLSVATLARLKTKHGLTPFHAANLNCGCFDLGLTPSAKTFGEARLILRTSDIRNFAARYLCGGGDTRDPDISPLYADVSGLPPALFTIGTSDALVDDSLLMALHWERAGNVAELKIVPGGCHAFTYFDTPTTHAIHQHMNDFVNAHIGDI